MSEPDPVVVLLKQIERHLQELAEATGRSSSPWMDIKQCAAYTGFTEGTIYNLVHKEVIPHSRPKGTVSVRFHRGAIDKWMASYRRAGRTRHKIEVILDTSTPSPQGITGIRSSRKEVPMEEE